MEQDVAPDSKVQVYSDGCYHGQSDKLSDATFTICKSYLATIRHPEADGCRKCALILLLSLAAIFDILLFGVGVAIELTNQHTLLHDWRLLPRDPMSGHGWLL